jgi:hypothetical protein
VDPPISGFWTRPKNKKLNPAETTGKLLIYQIFRVSTIKTNQSDIGMIYISAPYDKHRPLNRGP